MPVLRQIESIQFFFKASLNSGCVSEVCILEEYFAPDLHVAGQNKFGSVLTLFCGWAYCIIKFARIFSTIGHASFVLRRSAPFPSLVTFLILTAVNLGCTVRRRPVFMRVRPRTCCWTRRAGSSSRILAGRCTRGPRTSTGDEPCAEPPSTRPRRCWCEARSTRRRSTSGVSGSLRSSSLQVCVCVVDVLVPRACWSAAVCGRNDVIKRADKIVQTSIGDVPLCTVGRKRCDTAIRV